VKTFSLNPNTVGSPARGICGFAGNMPGEIEEKSSGN